MAGRLIVSHMETIHLMTLSYLRLAYPERSCLWILLLLVPKALHLPCWDPESAFVGLLFVHVKSANGSFLVQNRLLQSTSTLSMVEEMSKLSLLV